MARPTTLEDYLIQLHEGQWFGQFKNKTNRTRMY
jgi:hypothetical protein